MPINKEKLQAREQVSSSRPKFVRPESWRYKRLETNWRKPKGIDNHQRKQKSRGRPGLVKVGYGTPKIAYGLHPSGYTDNLVNNSSDLEKLNPNILQIAYESAMEQIAQKVAVQVKDLIYDNLLRLPEEAYNDEDVSMKTISVYQHGYSNYFGGGKSVYE